jgi:hypothetical protein
MVRVRLTKKLAAMLNGVDVSSLNVGDMIELPDSAARMLVAEQWAESVSDDGFGEKFVQTMTIVGPHR